MGRDRARLTIARECRRAEARRHPRHQQARFLHRAERLELAAERRRGDCETAYYLQAVLAEQKDWDGTARVASDAGACFDTEEAAIQQELATVRAAIMAAERRARLVARREAQLVSNARMRATVWFNAAAANFNLARTEEARRFAEKVADDAFYGDRAKSLLERLR
ncbi:MAG: hypothetical protein QM736_01295 [Vicinamibacterales bacterium]